jgi:hypothetical protein
MATKYKFEKRKDGLSSDETFSTVKTHLTFSLNFVSHLVPDIACVPATK